MEKPVRAKVATNVRRSRHERGWSLAELSRQVAEHRHKLTVPVLSKMELGDRGIDVDDLVALAAAFATSPGFLLTDPVVAEQAALQELLARREHLRVDLDHARNSVYMAAKVVASEQSEFDGLQQKIDEATAAVSHLLAAGPGETRGDD